jgi:hypothetical protein
MSSTCLRQVENVTNPADRPDPRRLVRTIFDLRAEPADVHFQVVPGIRLIRAPCVVQQLAPGDDPAGVVHQLPEDHELLVRQVHEFTADHELVAIELELYVTDSQDPQPSECPRIGQLVAACLRFARRCYTCWSLFRGGPLSAVAGQRGGYVRVSGYQDFRSP